MNEGMEANRAVERLEAVHDPARDTRLRREIEATWYEPRGVKGQLRDLLGLCDIARKEDHAAEPEFLRD